MMINELSRAAWVEQPEFHQKSVLPLRARYYLVPQEIRPNEAIQSRVVRAIDDQFRASAAVAPMQSSEDALDDLRYGRKEALAGNWKLAAEMFGRASKSLNLRVKAAAIALQARMDKSILYANDLTWAPKGPRYEFVSELGFKTHLPTTFSYHDFKVNLWKTKGWNTRQ